MLETLNKVTIKNGKLAIEGSEEVIRLLQKVTGAEGNGFDWMPLRVIFSEGERLICAVAGVPFFSVTALLEITPGLIEDENWHLLKTLLITHSSLVILVSGSDGKARLLFCENKDESSEFFRNVAVQYFQLIEGVQSREGLDDSVQKEVKREDVVATDEEETEKVRKEVKEEKAGKGVITEQPAGQPARRDFARPTTRQINFVRDLMVRSGFSQGLVEKFIELMSREEASQMIDYLKSKKKSSAIELINEVVARGLEDSGEKVQSGEETDLKEKDLITENVGAEEEIEEFDEEELPW